MNSQGSSDKYREAKPAEMDHPGQYEGTGLGDECGKKIFVFSYRMRKAGLSHSPAPTAKFLRKERGGKYIVEGNIVNEGK